MPREGSPPVPRAFACYAEAISFFNGATRPSVSFFGRGHTLRCENPLQITLNLNARTTGLICCPVDFPVLIEDTISHEVMRFDVGY